MKGTEEKGKGNGRKRKEGKEWERGKETRGRGDGLERGKRERGRDGVREGKGERGKKILKKWGSRKLYLQEKHCQQH